MSTSGGALSLRKVSKTFMSKRGDVYVLEDVDLEVEAASFVALVGPSGCGKSTLLRLISGLAPASSGTIEINGAPVEGPVDSTSFVFQLPVLLEWRTVLSNVLLPLEISKTVTPESQQYARELVEMAGLGEFAHRHPYELSGGMQQRVAICRALVTNPSLLLMDEPFGALDAITREEMGEELLRLWQETTKTVLFVTHSIEEAVLLADRVVVLGGRPSSTRLDLRMELDRPRSPDVRSTRVFADLREEVRASIQGSIRR